MAEPMKKPPHRQLRRLVPAFILDLVMAFFIFGFSIAWLSGGLTEDGFSLNGAPALIVLRHILGAAKPRNEQAL
jgi:hypothetical protein